MAANAIGPARLRLRRDIETLRGARKASTVAICLATTAQLLVVLLPNAMSIVMSTESNVVVIAYFSCVLKICSSMVPRFDEVHSLYETTEQSKIPNLDYVSNKIHGQMNILFTIASSWKIYLVFNFVLQCLGIVLFRSTYLDIVLPLTLLLMMAVVVRMAVNIRKKLRATERLIAAFRALEPMSNTS